MIVRIILAIVIGCLIGIACILIGGVLETLGPAPIERLGSGLVQFAWAIGILGALWYALAGSGFRMP